ncbi:MAG: 16S rRNA (uracil(1498)-N(3))-methyltransferase [Marinospirillum sp.]|uniref:16S rRNA (uracil(1498)-N(3))-methyltransferase n=1 Tax=Marinospirillum sp. TaxID=2183934 RepID=UPI0019DD7556|nr:16S rRNA (uracil(1498)-N(3))-methyltransferase [Marinospirillum sp.]MBE0505113.1 16S rRNA (uracil(1498)-N(3))-methyltransferase [Marinospirillum sp.]
MRRFYSPKNLAGLSEVELDGQVVRHMIQVLRMQPGDQLHLFDGQSCYLAELLQGNKNLARLQLIQPVEAAPPSPLHTHLGQAISKGDKMDWIIQKATELGVSAITPLYTRQGDVRLKGDREQKKLEHWQQVAISACEQCGRNSLPVIHPPQSLTDWLQVRQEAVRLLLHPHGQSAALATETPSDVALLIGPEGGLHEQEVEQAQKSGFSGLRLGPRILRTETAPLAALTLVQHWWGDLN